MAEPRSAFDHALDVLRCQVDSAHGLPWYLGRTEIAGSSGIVLDIIESVQIGIWYQTEDFIQRALAMMALSALTFRSPYKVQFALPNDPMLSSLGDFLTSDYVIPDCRTIAPADLGAWVSEVAVIDGKARKNGVTLHPTVFMRLPYDEARFFDRGDDYASAVVCVIPDFQKFDGEINRLMVHHGRALGVQYIVGFPEWTQRRNHIPSSEGSAYFPVTIEQDANGSDAFTINACGVKRRGALDRELPHLLSAIVKDRAKSMPAKP